MKPSNRDSHFTMFEIFWWILMVSKTQKSYFCCFFFWNHRSYSINVISYNYYTEVRKTHRKVFERRFEHLRVCPKTIRYGSYGYNNMGVLVIINKKFIENVTNVVFWRGKRIDCKIWSFFLVSSNPNSIGEPTITVYYVRDDM